MNRGTKKRKRPANASAKAPAKKKKEDFFIMSSDEEKSEKNKENGKNEQSNDELQEKLLKETPEEKRLRLAQEFLKKIEDELDEDEENKEDTVDRDSMISNRLKQQVFESRGKRKRKLGDQLSGVTIPQENVRFFRGHHLPVTCIALSPDEKSAYTGSKDCTIIKWDLETGKKLHTFAGSRHENPKKFSGHTGQVLAIALSSDGKFLASAGTDKLVHIWDTTTYKLLDSFKGHRDIVSALAFRVGSHQLFSGSHDRTVKIWNIDEMAYVETLFGHQNEITGIDSLHKERAITSSNDKTARIWKVVEETQLVYKGNNTSLDCLSMQTEDTFVTGSQDGSVSFWHATKKKPAFTVKDAHAEDGAPCWVTAVSSCKYSDITATGSHDGFIKLWRTSEDNTNASLIQQIPMKGFVNALAFNTKGSLLVAGIGKEHRLGRWSQIKEARNGIAIVRLPVDEE